MLRGWKSFTARRANEILGRGGAFWQREYYDRLIRDGDELRRAVRYVVNNPERAWLKGWKRVWTIAGDKFPAWAIFVFSGRKNWQLEVRGLPHFARNKRRMGHRRSFDSLRSLRMTGSYVDQNKAGPEGPTNDPLYSVA
jgi:hypothetical protein